MRGNGVPALKEIAQQTEIQHRNNILNNTWGIQEGGLFTPSESVLEGQGLINRRLLEKQKSWKATNFLSHPTS